MHKVVLDSFSKLKWLQLLEDQLAVAFASSEELFLEYSKYLIHQQGK